jgi:hypothetical protein
VTGSRGESRKRGGRAVDCRVGSRLRAGGSAGPSAAVPDAGGCFGRRGLVRLEWRPGRRRLSLRTAPDHCQARMAALALVPTGARIRRRRAGRHRRGASHGKARSGRPRTRAKGRTSRHRKSAQKAKGRTGRRRKDLLIGRGPRERRPAVGPDRQAPMGYQLAERQIPTDRHPAVALDRQALMVQRPRDMRGPGRMGAAGRRDGAVLRPKGALCPGRHRRRRIPSDRTVPKVRPYSTVSAQTSRKGVLRGLRRRAEGDRKAGPLPG